MEKIKNRSLWIWIISFIAISFGILTIKEGGTILFGNESARIDAGNYVPFVLWFNFIAGFFYIAAGVGIWMKQPLAIRLAVAITVATLFIFAAFGAHIYFGGAYEMRTVVAMSLRSLVWLVITIITRRQILHNKLIPL